MKKRQTMIERLPAAFAGLGLNAREAGIIVRSGIEDPKALRELAMRDFFRLLMRVPYASRRPITSLWDKLKLHSVTP